MPSLLWWSCQVRYYSFFTGYGLVWSALGHAVSMPHLVEACFELGLVWTAQVPAIPQRGIKGNRLCWLVKSKLRNKYGMHHYAFVEDKTHQARGCVHHCRLRAFPDHMAVTPLNSHEYTFSSFERDTRSDYWWTFYGSFSKTSFRLQLD